MVNYCHLACTTCVPVNVSMCMNHKIFIFSIIAVLSFFLCHLVQSTDSNYVVDGPDTDPTSQLIYKVCACGCGSLVAHYATTLRVCAYELVCVCGCGCGCVGVRERLQIFLHACVCGGDSCFNCSPVHPGSLLSNVFLFNQLIHMSCLSVYWNTDANLIGNNDLPDDWAVSYVLLT